MSEFKKGRLFLCLLFIFATGCAAGRKAAAPAGNDSGLIVASEAEEQLVLARNYYEEGMTLYHNGQVQQGEKLLISSLELDPDNPKVHNNLGVIYLAQKRNSEAAVEFRAAYQLDPGYDSARYNYALASLNDGNYREAYRVFKKLESLAEKPQKLDLYLGLTYYYLGKYNAAVKSLTLAAAQENGNAQAHYCLGISYYELKAYASAEEHLQKAISLEPELSFAYFYLATILQKQNSFSAAAEYWKKFLEFPAPPEWERIARKNLSICDPQFPASQQ